MLVAETQMGTDGVFEIEVLIGNAGGFALSGTAEQPGGQSHDGQCDRRCDVTAGGHGVAAEHPNQAPQAKSGADDEERAAERPDEPGEI